MAYKHYQLRETCPNPAGGPYRDVTPEMVDRNLDVATEALKHCFEREILPRLLENHGGNVQKVASSLAIMGAHMLHQFMTANRAEGQRQNLAIYNEVNDCMVGAIEHMQNMALMNSLGLDPRETVMIRV